MKEKPESGFTEIFAGDSWETGLLSSMLNDNGIRNWVLDEIMGRMNPWWTAPGGAGAIRVMVSSEDAEAARAVVEVFQNNRNP